MNSFTSKINDSYFHFLKQPRIFPTPLILREKSEFSHPPPLAYPLTPFGEILETQNPPLQRSPPLVGVPNSNAYVFLKFLLILTSI